MFKFLVNVTLVVSLSACGLGINRASAIEACGLVAGINDPVPNPRAGQEVKRGPYLPPPLVPVYEPNYIRPNDSTLRGRIAAARSRAATSGDAELQRQVDALRVTSDPDGLRPVVVVRSAVRYCNQKGY